MALGWLDFEKPTSFDSTRSEAIRAWTSVVRELARLALLDFVEQMTGCNSAYTLMSTRCPCLLSEMLGATAA